ncbi:F0F1 ATP synthase subunit gamma [Marinitenerispora sediminis]|uniref:ATP synthase gamma chain n=1 Tax=Marinitenerispora sediminis TaxID=1931232 RepID=A0A368T4B8_9ACTN|nr:F0F1 ATP synthase subunit gamma [Marinitenerispora sediminis]RCV56161.1 F0F1 ATP synthase subunit gamma [Marinitenerispora sediminis]RCV57513.1 F0F1 ATP synthase subunit gamma [Marinitenerispora sediminis]RCV57868.1 F0F1 ATP synthase subunit gamma [Marinitenerispora sediminis]
MGAQLRVYRRRIRSTKSMAKITRAMELIAATRITKAQRAAEAAGPYAREITRAVSALASRVSDHPLLTEAANPTRAAILVVTSDKGLAGAYSTNAIKEAESLTQLLREQGKEVLTYMVGRKGVAFYRFRERPLELSWEGITERPTYADAKEVGATLMERFTQDSAEGGVDEIHIVSTEFVSMLTQRAAAHRALPMELEEVDAAELVDDKGRALPLYEFEPSAEEALDRLLPQYVTNRIYFALLESAASQWASRRAAMKAATDNAEELVKNLTRQANQARQAEITNEISEIVGGADALAAASAGSE